MERWSHAPGCWAEVFSCGIRMDDPQVTTVRSPRRWNNLISKQKEVIPDGTRIVWYTYYGVWTPLEREPQVILTERV
jgi:hypothetical protein